MKYVTLKAATATVATDEGVFEAVISTENVDREQDIVSAKGMVAALRAWTATGKLIPLAWNHSAKAEDIVGHIDPATVEEVDGEVMASGWIDQDTYRGRHVWRLAKSGTLGFSFGYMTRDSIRRADGVREIRELDVFEISATATPMNADTRVLSTKSADTERDVRVQARELMLSSLLAAPERAPEPAVSVKARPPVQIASFDA